MKLFKDLEKSIDIKFKDEKIYIDAFTHRSYTNEHRTPGVVDNERLEFLGDAVLELVSTKHLYNNYPDQDEGKMTSFRSALVKGQHLAEVAVNLNLGKYLRLSHGEERSGGREKGYILANALEAMIGAIYLDRGYPFAEKFIQQNILSHLDGIINRGLHIDSKSKFQELSQEKLQVTPVYKIIAEEGPDHDKKFTMGAYINDELVATGEGSSKQKAEDQAAHNALIKKGWNTKDMNHAE